ncbi:MAG: CvpA family protein [Synergistaceae bacterium]|jgi:membrane protein required for colicin V production|nr:CvpA family protein [Synergistaceae bacterium]
MTFARVFDIGTACMFAFFIVRGTLRGLTGEIVSLLGLIASVTGAWTFAQPLTGVVLSYFPGWDPTVMGLVCSAVIFVAISLVFAVVGKILRSLVKAANLSLLDHLTGAVSGAARAFVIILLVYGVISVFSPLFDGDWMKESWVMSSVAAVWPGVLKILADNGWIDVTRLTPDALMEVQTGVQNEILKRSLAP